jgi:sugar lactone lactonase YvrE
MLAARTRRVIITRRGTWFRRWDVALGGAIVAAVALVAVLSQPDSVPGNGLVAVTAARPPVTDSAARTLKTGDRLNVATTVKTGPGGRITLTMRGGSELTLNAETELVLASRNSARLRSGEVYCRSRAGEIRKIITAAGRIHLLGTVLDAETQGKRSVAVTVVRGRVRLSNSHGEAVVPAGKRSLLVASRPPEPGQPVNTMTQAAWYDGRGKVLSDFGDIAYFVQRADRLITEVWAMNSDGTNKRRVKTYVGGMVPGGPGPWLPGEQWLMVKAHYAPLLKEPTQIWLLNVATGQEVVLQLPAAYHMFMAKTVRISPDGRRVAFRACDPRNIDTIWDDEYGVWVYDVRTGETRQAVRDEHPSGIEWAPDSRRLVVCDGSYHRQPDPIAMVDTDSGATTRLDVQGLQGVVSPDGRRLAYCADFTWSDSPWRSTHNTLFVLDLVHGGAPVQVSPAGGGGWSPTWSPDGTRVAYCTSRRREEAAPQKPGGLSAPDVHFEYAIFAAGADGSGVQEIYRASGRLVRISWAPSGDAIYVVTADGVLLIAADGSGLMSDLGGNERDSILTDEEMAQTRAAMSDLREALTLSHFVGYQRTYESRVAETRAAYNAAADLFAGLMWRYPVVRFSAVDVLASADKAADLAKRPAEHILLEGCEFRISHLHGGLALFVRSHGRLPSDLRELQSWSLRDLKGRYFFNYSHNGVTVKVPYDDGLVRMTFCCPGSRLLQVPAPYAYTPPGGRQPKTGDLLVRCPRHSQHRIVWDEDLARELKAYRKAAARSAPNRTLR